MSRSGYVVDEFDGEGWELALWRGTVNSSINGKRGQKLLRELRDALDAMPEKRLIANELRNAEGVCALGCVGAARGVELEKLDVCNYDELANVFDVAAPLVRELEYVNDGDSWDPDSTTPEQRWRRVRGWVERCIGGR
jgi:hypothetical protein